MIPFLFIVAAAAGAVLLSSSSSSGRASTGARARAAIGRPSLKQTYPLEDSEQTRKILELRANAMAQGNAVWLGDHPEVLEAACCVSCMGARYIDPPICGTDDECQLAQDASALVQSKEGTCIELAAYDAGAHLAKGHDAVVVLEPRADARGGIIPFSYHAVVYVEGVREDPTAEILERDAANVGGGGCGCG